MHIYHVEEFIVFLQPKIVTFYESLQLEELQAKYNALKQRAIPLHEQKRFDTLELPLDDYTRYIMAKKKICALLCQRGLKMDAIFIVMFTVSCNTCINESLEWQPPGDMLLYHLKLF